MPLETSEVLRDHRMNHRDERFDHYRHAPLTPPCQLFSKRLHLLPN